MVSARRWLAACLVFALLSALVVRAEEDASVTCGSVVKLLHSSTKFFLHSHEIAYGSGSGQQSVTAYPQGEDSNSFWRVVAPLGGSCPQGDRIPGGAIVRLQHLETRKWLHSHRHTSPLSGNQEISAYVGENTGDHWRVECEGHWVRDRTVSFFHVDTGVYLHSHTKAFPRPIEGQHEVCGANRKTKDADWQATQGIYFEPADAPDRSEL